MQYKYLTYPMLCFSLAGTPVLAAKDGPMQPSGPWRVHIDDQQCMAFRPFGAGDEEVIFRLVGTGYSRQMALLGKPVPTRNFDTRLGLQTDRQSSPTRVSGYVFRTTDGRDLAQWDDDDRNLTTEWRKAKSVTIGIGGWSRVLPLTQFDAVMVKIKECEDALMTSWGVSPEQLANYTRDPTPINAPGSWLSRNDYPPEALAAGLSGNLVFALDVAADGAVIGCTVLRTSSLKHFDDAACTGIKRRAKMQPALDGCGQPVKSRYIDRVIFQTR